MLQLNHLVTLGELKALLKAQQLKSVTDINSQAGFEVCTVFVVLFINIFCIFTIEGARNEAFFL